MKASSSDILHSLEWHFVVPAEVEQKFINVKIAALWIWNLFNMTFIFHELDGKARQGCLSRTRYEGNLLVTCFKLRDRRVYSYQMDH